MLTYWQVHLYYNIPPIIVLWILFQPFITKFDKVKILAMSIFAIVYATPWDNYMIYLKVWWYGKDAVIGRIGLAPIEEYIFFVTQTVFTSLWTIFCTRWTMHSQFLRKPSRTEFYCKRYIVSLALAVLSACGWFYADVHSKWYYLCAITWWAMPFLTFTWYIAGNFISQQLLLVLLSVFAPSFYLWFVDINGLRGGVWHINEATSLEIFFFNDLPLEEVLFFIISNFILVFGLLTLDRSKAILNTFSNSPVLRSKLAKSTTMKGKLTIAALTDEIDLPANVIDDIKNCIQVSEKDANPFSIAANLFSNGNLFILA